MTETRRPRSLLPWTLQPILREGVIARPAEDFGWVRVTVRDDDDGPAEWLGSYDRADAQDVVARLLAGLVEFDAFDPEVREAAVGNGFVIIKHPRLATLAGHHAAAVARGERDGAAELLIALRAEVIASAHRGEPLTAIARSARLTPKRVRSWSRSSLPSIH